MMRGLLMIVAAAVLSIALTGETNAQWGGHWTYPGDIASHLATGHGVSAAGMTREQAETLHDQLHASGRVNVQRSVSYRRVGVRPFAVVRGWLRRR